MKIFLIRHGETTGDIEDRYGGTYDDHLTERGKQQLTETAAHMQNSGIEVIFASPLIRAQESANIISHACNVPVQTVEGLKERHYGVLTGLTKAEARERYPEEVEAHKDPTNTDPEGESLFDFTERVANAFTEIKNKNIQSFAIVAHGGSLKQILSYLGETVPDSIGDGEILEVQVPR